MKRLTAVLLSLIFVVAIGATAFAAFDTSRIDRYFETETQKRIDSMLAVSYTHLTLPTTPYV